VGASYWQVFLVGLLMHQAGSLGGPANAPGGSIGGPSDAASRLIGWACWYGVWLVFELRLGHGVRGLVQHGISVLPASVHCIYTHLKPSPGWTELLRATKLECEFCPRKLMAGATSRGSFPSLLNLALNIAILWLYLQMLGTTTL
jgi:hypothetical protein